VTLRSRQAMESGIAAWDEQATTNLESLPRQAKAVWQITNAAIGLCALVLCALLFGTILPETASGPLGIVAAVVISVTLLEALVLIPRRYRFHRFFIGPDRLVSVRGSVVRRMRIQPWRHVLFVEVRQGLLLRMFGLFRVRIGTIADEHLEGPFTADVVQRLRRAAGAGDE